MEKMNADVKEKWITALKSGDYTQARSKLKTRDVVSSQIKHCCLGVLCEITMEMGLIEEGKWGPGNPSYCFYAGSSLHSSYTMPPNPVMEATGLGEIEASRLATLNDDGDDFLQIADWIEENL